MIHRTIIAAALVAVTLPVVGTAALAAPHRHPGHPGHPGHHGPHGPGPHRGPGPHHGPGPHPHPGFGPRHGFGPRVVIGGPRVIVRGGRRIVIRPAPIVVARPVYAGVPAAGGCSTRRTVSLTPYGWHRIVTSTTCIRP